MPVQQSSQVAAGFKVGDILAGKYRIEHILGTGGMGVVVAAYHIHLEEPVAIKFLLPEMLDNSEVVARFAREARAAVKIKNEHVARVTDVGTLDNGAPYMVMEHLKGADLSTVLMRRGSLPIADVAEYVLQACEAISEAHALGIVHRDLKPANLFLVRQSDGTDSIKVLDFGISKMTGLVTSRSGMALTGTMTAMGSPLYMSPEQMSSSRDVDARTDIWAIGAILYELVTGRPPFDAETIPQLCAMILQERPPPMSDRRADLPPGFEAVVLRCLQKDRDARYANVGELAVELVPFAPKRARLSVERIGRILESAGAGTITVPPSDAPSPMGHAEDDNVVTAPRRLTLANAWGAMHAGQRPWSTLVIRGVVALFVLIALGTLWIARGGETESSEQGLVVTPLAPAAPEPPPVGPGSEPKPVAQVPVAPEVPLPPSTAALHPTQPLVREPAAVPAPSRVLRAEPAAPSSATTATPPRMWKAAGGLSPQPVPIASPGRRPGHETTYRAPSPSKRTAPLNDDIYGARK